MKPISYDGKVFSTYNVSAGIPADSGLAGPARQPVILASNTGQPSAAGVVQGERILTVQFGVKPGNAIEATMQTLLGAIDVGSAAERTLVMLLDDGTTNVQAQATIGQWAWISSDKGTIAVDFVVTSDRYEKTSATVDGPTSFSATGTRALTVAGKARTKPVYKIGWSVQRPSTSLTVGWRYRKQFTVTNNGSRTMRNYPVQLGPIDTAALVTAGKMRSTGSDLNIFANGEKLQRNVYGRNTTTTFVWFTVDELTPGATRTYDFVYGNSSIPNLANSNFSYSNPDSPVINIDSYSSTATAGGASTITESTAGFVVNELAGVMIFIWSGTGAGQYRRVLSNTATVITVTRAWATNPDATSKYVTWASGMKADGGKASAAGTTSNITDSSQNWITNEWIGATVTNVTKALTGVVASNNGTTLTISGTWTAPVLNDVYTVTQPNGLWQWNVAQTQRDTSSYHRGLFFANKGDTKPSIIKFDNPGSWYRTTYLKNNDDYSQYRITSSDVGGDIDYFTILNVHRQRGGGGGYTEEGQSDAVSIMNPFGFLATRFDWQFLSPSATCQAIFGCRESGGEDWETVFYYNTASTVLTAVAVQSVDLTAYGTPIHLVQTLQPADTVEIPNTVAHKSIVTSNTIMEATIDTRNLVISALGAEQDIYHMTLTLRLDGTATPTPPYDTVVIGGAGSADVHNVFIPSTQKIWLDGETGAIGLYTGNVWTADAQYAATFTHHEYDRTGVDTAYRAAELMPLTPGSHTLYVSDAVGNIGTISVEVDYSEGYFA